MKPTMKAGPVLGILVFLWTLLMGVTGWYKDPDLLNLFYVVILIEIGVLVWGLRLTAAEGRSYAGQVSAGTMISVLGAVIVFFGSLLFTVVLYPGYFEEVREAGRVALASRGMSEAEITASLDAQAPMQTPFMQAIIGAIMTVLTGVAASAVLGLFIRKKGAA